MAGRLVSLSTIRWLTSLPSAGRRACSAAFMHAASASSSRRSNVASTCLTTSAARARLTASASDCRLLAACCPLSWLLAAPLLDIACACSRNAATAALNAPAALQMSRNGSRAHCQVAFLQHTLDGSAMRGFSITCFMCSDKGYGCRARRLPGTAFPPDRHRQRLVNLHRCSCCWTGLRMSVILRSALAGQPERDQGMCHVKRSSSMSTSLPVRHVQMAARLLHQLLADVLQPGSGAAAAMAAVPGPHLQLHGTPLAFSACTTACMPRRQYIAKYSR